MSIYIYGSELMESYMRLPLWLREEFYCGRVGYSYSGDELLGWSYVFLDPYDMHSSISHDLAFIPSDPNYYFGKIRELFFDEASDMEFFVLSDSSFGYEIGLSLPSLDGVYSDVSGRGVSRLCAFLDLMLKLCLEYSSRNNPTVSDIGSFCSSAELFSDDSGYFSVGFPSYREASEFILGHRRFFIRDPSSSDMFCGVQNLHGELTMLEGSARVYSCYGVSSPSSPSYPSSPSSILGPCPSGYSSGGNYSSGLATFPFGNFGSTFPSAVSSKRGRVIFRK